MCFSSSGNVALSRKTRCLTAHKNHLTQHSNSYPRLSKHISSSCFRSKRRISPPLLGSAGRLFENILQPDLPSISNSQRSWVHFGPKHRISGFFERKDQLLLALEAKTGASKAQNRPIPAVHQDLLEAVANVGQIESRIGYKFKNKLTAVEALMRTPQPIYYKGLLERKDRNNRLALLGDRLLSLVLCEVWYGSGRSSGTRYHSPFLLQS